MVGVFVLLQIASYYILRGGNSDNGAVCGMFYVSAGRPTSNAGWAFGAALSFSNHMKTIK